MNGITFGTVSHGTLRSEDLLAAFAGELESLLAQNPEHDGEDLRKLISEANTIDPESDEACDVVNELQDSLDALAPSYCYFGAHEGDGSDFGFWPSIAALEDAARCGEVLKLDAGDEIPADWSGEVMFVTDHGNVTFGYVGDDGAFVEVWSVV